MERRKFVVGLGALASGSAAAVGTGAFTNITATRNVDVSVADDASAYLSLQGTGGDNSAYVTDDGDGGTLSINLDGDNSTTEGGQGVNPDALTKIDSLFTIKNQGTQEVTVSISKDGANSNLVKFYPSTSYSSAIGSNSLTLGTGDSETVSIEIDTRGAGVGDGDELLDAVTFTADAT
ncbi:DUF1102 domain-containing protein [Halorubrum sp. C3]|nr:DUF1102 domain-containing protein [Halorubrum sp. C3]